MKMRSQSLGLITLSALACSSSTVLAKFQSRNERLNNLKYKDFVYPHRARAQELKENQIDLGYEIHEGKLEKDKFLAFRNIPYAEPPTESDLRWFAAVEPQSIREEVNKGLVDHKCPQEQVGWVPIAKDFLGNFSEGILPPRWRDEIKPEDYGAMPEPIPGVDEDCLTLDVMVPKTVWEKKEEASAAVIVWIYGGGFVYGWKDLLGSPAGLFEAAEGSQHDGNVIYVAMNYRLGAFGWLGGPKFRQDGGLPNLGLHDQRFAMKWVQRYIQAFGGDPERVTVMGQSAGASSILHHLTAGGGNRDYKPLFDKAIVQSAGFFPQPDPAHDDRIYEKYLELTGAKNLEELLEKDTEVLQEANTNMTFKSPYGIFNFGPTVDGDYVPSLPGKLLSGGSRKTYHQGISLMVGHTAYDGLLFTPPWIRSPAQLREHSWKLYPGIPESVLQFIDEHYPIKTSPLILAQKKIANVSDFLDDIAIQCNSYYLTEAFLTSFMRAPVYRYSFNTLPAIHGYDTGYTYYPSPSLLGPADETLAKFFQKSIVNFARFGVPDPDNDVDEWPMYTSEEREVMNLGKPGQTEQDFSYGMGPDLLDREKCAYWQSAPYYIGKEPKNVKFVQQERLYKEGL
ncbi:hypothetical protein ONS95_006900 [Cadophora gregata]|uniref:uncharacterized protein n=1 Tax=Cadophora gregata TaxID=51156 RepID=UPI0026DD0D89|nr:uncharacterized protein ONS95_006900 [Cadophora gregata]KAK0101748.1 hypothetical protein ONS95_006900 [Cadophora gregata]